MDSTSELCEKNDNVSENINERNRWRAPLEPAILLTFISIFFSYVVYQNQVIKLTCTNIFGYNETVCDSLGTPNASNDIKNADKIVQPYAANILMTRQICDTVPPAVIGLFLGTWSDKFGRKPILIASILGFALSSALITIFSIVSSTYALNPWFYVFVSLPSSLPGGICSLFGGAYSYIADTATLTTRPVRLAILGACQAGGIFLGNLISGYIFAATNATVVFAISTTFGFIGVCYMFFVPESLSPHLRKNTSKLRGLLEWDLVGDMLATLARRREIRARMILWISMAVLCLGMFAEQGPSHIFFMYVREKLSWNVTTYSTYNAISMLVGAVSTTIVIIIFQKYLEFSMPSIALIGIASSIVDTVLKAIATESWILYLAIGVTLAKGATFPMCRALISKVVSSDEIGKIYSLATAFEFITPLASAPLFTYVYSSTLHTYSGAFNLVGASIYMICFVIFIVLFIMERRYLRNNSEPPTG